MISGINPIDSLEILIDRKSNNDNKIDYEYQNYT